MNSRNRDLWAGSISDGLIRILYRSLQRFRQEKRLLTRNPFMTREACEALLDGLGSIREGIDLTAVVAYLKENALIFCDRQEQAIERCDVEDALYESGALNMVLSLLELICEDPDEDRPAGVDLESGEEEIQRIRPGRHASRTVISPVVKESLRIHALLYPESADTCAYARMNDDELKAALDEMIRTGDLDDPIDFENMASIYAVLHRRGAL